LGLPGITRDQMVEVDRIMVNDYNISVELMMEHAGLNLARLALAISKTEKYNFIIIAGTGNNAGGGIVAARRLKSWGLKVKLFLVKGVKNLGNIPGDQFNRVQKLDIEWYEGLPEQYSTDSLIIDAYLGYNFTLREDKITDSVFEFLSIQNNVLCLDNPSGLDINTGERYSNIKPLATLTLAFVKKGLLITNKEYVGELYIADIGIPINVYYQILKDNWSHPYKQSSLENLYSVFSVNSLQKVRIHRGKDLNENYWEIY